MALCMNLTLNHPHLNPCQKISGIEIRKYENNASLHMQCQLRINLFVIYLDTLMETNEEQIEKIPMTAPVIENNGNKDVCYATTIHVEKFQTQGTMSYR